eukprot:gene7179-14626_t
MKSILTVTSTKNVLFCNCNGIRYYERSKLVYPNISLAKKKHYKVAVDAVRPSSSRPIDNQKGALRATQVGAGVNLSLALMKGVTGWTVGSTALIADAVNNLGDLFTDGVVYLSITHARQKSCQNRPWGSGKIEPLGALTVGSLVVCTGGGIGYTSLYTLYDMYTTTSIVETVATSTSMGFAALGVSVAAILSKEALFHYTLRAGKKSNSASVIANAWQHRADAMISGAAFIGFAGSMIGYKALDPLAAVFLAGIIVKQGISITCEAVEDLRDSPTTKEETEKLRNTCLNVPGVMGIKQIRARRAGPYIFVECTVILSEILSISDGYKITTLVKETLMNSQSDRIANVLVDFCPSNEIQ